MKSVISDLYDLYIKGKMNIQVDERYNEVMRKMENSVNKMSECLTPEEYKYFADYQQACDEIDQIVEKEIFTKALSIAIIIIIESMRSA